MVGSNLLNPRNELIATFDYVDIANGTGIEKFYLYESYDDSGSRLFLDGESNLVDEITLGGTASTSSFVKKEEKSYDLAELNSARTIRGQGQFKLRLRINGTGGIGGQGYAIIKIKKWDGASATTLATAQSRTNSVGGGGDATLNDIILIDIPTSTIKKGENIRVTIEAWVKNNTTGSYTITIGNNDQWIKIPFRIEA